MKNLNNIVEFDHGKLKRLIKPLWGFQSIKTAYATLKGFEVMRAVNKNQGCPFQNTHGLMGEICLVERNFGIYAA